MNDKTIDIENLFTYHPPKAAIRKVREAVMTANAAIALNE